MWAGILTIFSLLKAGLTDTIFPAVTRRLGHEDKKQGFVHWARNGCSTQRLGKKGSECTINDEIPRRVCTSLGRSGPSLCSINGSSTHPIPRLSCTWHSVHSFMSNSLFCGHTRFDMALNRGDMKIVWQILQSRWPNYDHNHSLWPDCLISHM